MQHIKRAEASERTEVAHDPEWCKRHLNNYASLFLGEDGTVAHGDKCSGTNHSLASKRAGH